MEPLVVFVLQFLWFLFAWSLIVYFMVWPVICHVACFILLVRGRGSS